MSVLGVDSTRTLDRKALHATEVKAVGRYAATTPGGSWKAESLNELRAYRADGFGVWLCWETTATRALTGRASGAQDARRMNDAMDALGFPDTIPACWTCDTDVPNDGKAAADYAYGWHSASRRPSACYAEASVIDAGIAAGVIVTGWQTNAKGWNADRRYVSPHASIRQGLPSTSPIPGTDPDDVDETSPLVWWPDSHPTPSTPPTHGGLTMLDPDVQKAFADLGTGVIQTKAAVDKLGVGVVETRADLDDLIARLEAKGVIAPKG